MKNSPSYNQLLHDQCASFFDGLDKSIARLPLYVGLSGGVDSVVLCHALHSFLSSRSFTIVHINHQLQKNAHDFLQRSQALAKQLNVPIVVKDVQIVHRSRHSIEAQARKVRYQAFIELLEPNAMLLLAHHQNDQAETFLLNALRGADVNALGGMQAIRKHQDIWIGRPLLNISRKDILGYALQFDLQWTEDVSNADETLKRNFLRHGVLKKIEDSYPGASKMLARSAIRLQIVNQYIKNEADAFLHTQKHAHILSLNAWKRLSSAVAIAVLRLWFQHHGLPKQNQLNEICACFRKETGRGKFQWRSEQGKMVCFVWRGHAFIYNFEQLNEMPINYKLKDGYEVRHRILGQTVLFKGQKRQVKTLLKQMSIFPWWRHDFPILFKEGHAVMLGKLCLDEKNHRVELVASQPYQLEDL